MWDGVPKVENFFWQPNLKATPLTSLYIHTTGVPLMWKLESTKIAKQRMWFINSVWWLPPCGLIIKKVSLCTKLFLNPSGSNFIGGLAFVIAHSSYGGCGIVEVLIFLYADYIKYNLFFLPKICLYLIPFILYWKWTCRIGHQSEYMATTQ